MSRVNIYRRLSWPPDTRHPSTVTRLAGTVVPLHKPTPFAPSPPTSTFAACILRLASCTVTYCVQSYCLCPLGSITLGRVHTFVLIVLGDTFILNRQPHPIFRCMLYLNSVGSPRCTGHHQLTNLPDEPVTELPVNNYLDRSLCTYISTFSKCHCGFLWHHKKDSFLYEKILIYAVIINRFYANVWLLLIIFVNCANYLATNIPSGGLALRRGRASQVLAMWSISKQCRG